jgi:hypothetical protein
LKDEVKLADWVLSRHSDLASERAPWDTVWQELAEFCLPRKAEISAKRSMPDTSRHDVLFDTTAMQGAATLANGQLAYITPADSPVVCLRAAPRRQQRQGEAVVCQVQ